MANRNLPTYYLVEADMLPEIFLKVMEAKELLQTGECSTVGDAVNRVGISRSAFYKYKDSITAFQDLRHGHILTFQVMLRDQTGLLSAVLSEYPHDQSEHSGERLRHDHHQRRDRRNEREHGNAHEPPRRRRRCHPCRDFSGIRPI